MKWFCFLTLSVVSILGASKKVLQGSDSLQHGRNLDVAVNLYKRTDKGQSGRRRRVIDPGTRWSAPSSPRSVSPDANPQRHTRSPSPPPGRLQFSNSPESLIRKFSDHNLRSDSDVSMGMSMSTPKFTVVSRGSDAVSHEAQGGVPKSSLLRKSSPRAEANSLDQIPWNLQSSASSGRLDSMKSPSKRRKVATPARDALRGTRRLDTGMNSKLVVLHQGVQPSTSQDSEQKPASSMPIRSSPAKKSNFELMEE